MTQQLTDVHQLLPFRGRHRFWWPYELLTNVAAGLILSVPNVIPTISVSTSKIEETPVDDTLTLSVPAVPTVAVSTGVVGYTEISGVTISIASPCIVTSVGHGIADDEEIFFATTGALPTGLVQFTHYYASYIDADTFSVAATVGGANINTSGSQSGVQSVWHVT